MIVPLPSPHRALETPAAWQMEHGLRKSSECHWVMQVGDVRCSSDSGVKADIAAGLTCAITGLVGHYARAVRAIPI